MAKMINQSNCSEVCWRLNFENALNKKELALLIKQKLVDSFDKEEEDEGDGLPDDAYMTNTEDDVERYMLDNIKAMKIKGKKLDKIQLEILDGGGGGGDYGFVDDAFEKVISYLKDKGKGGEDGA